MFREARDIFEAKGLLADELVLYVWPEDLARRRHVFAFVSPHQQAVLFRAGTPVWCDRFSREALEA